MRVAAIVPAAGKGKRINSKIDKPYIKLCGKPIIAHTLLRLSKNRHIYEIIVAVSRKRIDRFRQDIVKRYRIKKVKAVIGGRKRQDSVSNALKGISKDIDYVLIHDCARPFVTDSLIESSLRAAQRFGASVVGVPVKSTLKKIGKRGCIDYTPERRYFWEAQTPQVFRKELIERAYRRAKKKKVHATDDSMLVENIRVKPKVVLGSYSNIKITTPEDLELARILLKNSKFE